jgi:predicted N-acetyltransferase YhbS
VVIRPALLTDADAIARLTSELGYPSTIEQISSRLEYLLAREAYFIAVAELDGNVVGWIAAEERTILESGTRAELVGLVVADQARRTGVGSALVREAESWSRRRGVASIFVRSNITRAEAHPFYENLGYARSKTQHAYTKRLEAST